MSIELQQYMMARLLKTQGTPGLSGRGSRDFFTALCARARERYWLILSEEERATEREALQSQAPLSGTYVDLARANWQPGWNNGARDPDYFRQYLVDQEAAKNVWKLMKEEVVIVVDKNRQVLFASFDKLCQFLYGQELVSLITRALDMWSFYTPLPAPETARHVVDDYVRRIHPELDPAKATVDQLPNAKTAVAHYGCWDSKGDPQGYTIYQSRNMPFTRSLDLEGPASLFASLCD
ncbi:hypothetical protein B0T14DRAFT_567906 [Immersiella caudata]|uniref:Uncharacterized protein n=1 Tax=Immersiella caudata TaxID=314043 RepID=A0AA40BWI9_9PEZI|nr:hypothetical protein B0T14DRAFT_567906 [Immersiella caudata]